MHSEVVPLEHLRDVINPLFIYKSSCLEGVLQFAQGLITMYFQHHSGTSPADVSLREDANGMTCGPVIAWVDSASFRRALERRYPVGLLSAEEIQALIESFTNMKTGKEYICTPPVPRQLPHVAQSELSDPPLRVGSPA